MRFDFLHLPGIDNRTLLIGQTIVTAVYALTFFGVGRFYPHLRGTRSVALGFASGFVGCLLLAGRGNLPPVLTVVLANFLAFSAYALFYRGILQVCGSKGHLPIAWSAVGVASLGIAIFSLRFDRIVLRIVIASIALFLLRALAAVELFRHSRGRALAKSFALWLAFMAVFGLNRIVLTPIFGAPSDYMHRDIIQTSNLVLGTAYVFTLGIFFLILLYGELLAGFEAQAELDPLSGCLNRRGIEMRLASELKRVRRTGQKLSIALIDLDSFKEINDTRGHAAGDRALRDVASIISLYVRPTDTFGRYGGDEFLLLLPRASCNHAAAVAERLRLAVQQAFERGDGPHVTLSIGMAEADPDEPVAPLLERADTALYDAKRSGRNCTRFLRRDKSTEPTGRADTPGSLVAGSLPDVRSNSAFLPDAIGSQSLSHTGSAPPLEKSLA